MKYKKFFNVAGVMFEGRQEVLEELVGDEVVYLKPEPENQYDPNAVAVWIKYPPEASTNDAKIGYVPKAQASEYAAMMRVSDFTAEIEERVGGFQTSAGERAAYGLVIRCEASYDANPY